MEITFSLTELNSSLTQKNPPRQCLWQVGFGSFLFISLSALYALQTEAAKTRTRTLTTGTATRTRLISLIRLALDV